MKSAQKQAKNESRTGFLQVSLHYNLVLYILYNLVLYSLLILSIESRTGFCYNSNCQEELNDTHTETGAIQTGLGAA